MTAMLHWSKQQRTEGMRIQGMVSKTTNKHFYCTIAKKSYINQHLFTSSIAKRTLYSVNGQCSKTTGKLVNRMPDYSELNEWMAAITMTLSQTNCCRGSKRWKWWWRQLELLNMCRSVASSNSSRMTINTTSTLSFYRPVWLPFLLPRQPTVCQHWRQFITNNQLLILYQKLETT